MDCSNRGDAILLFAIKPFKTEDLSLKGGQKRKKKNLYSVWNAHVRHGTIVKHCKHLSTMYEKLTGKCLVAHCNKPQYFF